MPVLAGSQARNETYERKDAESNIAPAIMPSDSRLTREDDKTTIFFYNIAPREHKQPRYPNFPHLTLRACPKGRPFILTSLTVTDPFIEYRQDNDFNRIPFETDGFRTAAKILCPMNYGIDQDFALDLENDIHQGDNLAWQGVFWTIHQPGDAEFDEELAKCRARLEATYRKEIERMIGLEAEGGAETARRSATWIAHAAAEYFGQSFSWHRTDLTQVKDAGKISCGVCAEKIQSQAKICIHCGAPTDPEKQEQWLEKQFRGPGRPKSLDQDGR